MKKHIALIILLAIAGIAKSQSGTPLAQYSGNQIIYNPGFAGSYDLFSINLSVRHLWIGIPNSPTLISFNAHAPFQNLRNAIGFVYQRETFGPQSVHTVNATYAHKIYFGSTSFLSLGVQGGLFNSVTNWNMVDDVWDEDDPLWGQGRQRTNRFDMNLGAYFQAEDFYLGASVRHLTSPRFDEVTVQVSGIDDRWYSRVPRQFFFMGGYNFRLTDELDLRPHVLMRYKNNVPFTFSASVNLVYDNRFFVGTNFMTGQNAVSLFVAAEIIEGLRVGYSFDMNFGVLRPFQRGSHEISINYALHFWGGRHGMEKDIERFIRRNWQW